ENLAIDYRWAENESERLRVLAADLVRRQVKVIAAIGAPASIAAAKATTTIPIVFGVPEDLVGLGLVASLARPGGNATGVHFFSAEWAAKRLEPLRELVPTAKRVAVLLNPAEPTIAAANLRDVEAAASAVAVQIRVFNASTIAEIDTAFAALASERPDALFISSGPFFLNRRVQIAHLPTRYPHPRHWSPAPLPGSRGGGGLGGEPARRAPPTRGLWRPHPQRRQARRPAGRAVDQIRTGHQCLDRQDARSRRTTDPARPRRRGDRVKRRDFITLLGGAAATWPFVARAQQREGMRHVGVFSALLADDAEWQARLAAFHQGLQELGWTVGRNIRIEYRLGAIDAERRRKYAAELVALAPDAIVVNGTTPLVPLLQATRSLP